MASSNRHWPSMFKSKPCNSHHQWQHDINSPLISSNDCPRSTPYSSSGCEERSPEPKPRWNPRPEQIRILEAIFNSGMVNPPRDEIRKIRAQLQEYGQVGDANVFYWFQNRKSRSKHKQHHQIPHIASSAAPSPTNKTALQLSSSSSEKSSQNSADKTLSSGSKNVIDPSNSPTASVNQPFLQNPSDFLSVPFFFPVQQPPPPTATVGSPTAAGLSQGFCFSDVTNAPHVDDNSIQSSSTSLLLSDLLLMNHAPTKKIDDDKIRYPQPPVSSYYALTTAPAAASQTQSMFSPTAIATLSAIDHIQECGGGVTGGVGPTKSTVFINDVAFEVTTAPFHVREAFGDDAILLHSSGQPVLTNEWGVTLQPLQHGAFYYLIRTLTSSAYDTTNDLI